MSAASGESDMAGGPKRPSAGSPEPRADARQTPRDLRLFSSPRGAPRFRRPTDVVMLAFAALGLAFLAITYPHSGFELSLSEFVADFPGWMDPVWGFVYDLLWLWAAVLIVAAVAARRYGVALHAFSALVLGGLVAIVAARIAIGDWPDLADAALGRAGATRFPAVRLAEATAVIITVAGHLVLPAQRIGRWILALATLGALFASGAAPFGVLAGLLAGTLAAAAVRLAFGTSAGRPRVEDIRSALGALGVTADRVAFAERQVVGVVTAHARDAEGRRLLVRVYGRDAYDNRLLARLWRRTWYRDTGSHGGLSPREGVEHEALVTLIAARGGIPTNRVVTAGAPDGDAVIVLRDEGTALADEAAENLDERLLPDAWATLERLADSGIAHLGIDASTVISLGGRFGLTGFAGATLTPRREQLMTDRAQLLATTAALFGADRAVAAAVHALGTEGLTSLLPYLQPAAFSRALRRALKRAEIDVDELRKQAAAAVDVKPPELVPLRRVTLGSVVQVGLLVLAASAVIGYFGGIDVEELGSALADASWGWIVAAFVVAQLPRLTQSVATLGTVPAKLPFGPVYAMQLATGYINLALPSAIGRAAVSIRFFQRQGLPAPVAVSSGVLDSLASSVVQVLLCLLILLFASSSVSLGVEAPDTSGMLRLLVTIVVLLVLTAAVAALVPRLRRAVLTHVRHWLPQVRSTFAVLRTSNKLVALALGNVATEVLFAIALGLFARGIGYDIALWDLVLINTGVSLVSTLIPVPGGIGVTEAGLTIGLASVGVPESAALAIAILHRLAAFYIPPAWGFLAMRWLERNRYL